MIQEATKSDLFIVAEMLQAMYLEMRPDYAVEEFNIYVGEVLRCYNDPKQTIFIDSSYRGFFIMQDETEPMTPGMKVYQGTRVYIKPEFRKSKLLKTFYEAMFEHYPDGDILGVTIVGSEHIQVLNKRHELIANVYKLRRNK